MLLCGIIKPSFVVPSRKLKLKLYINEGTVNLLTASINVLPMQMRYPPKNGEKLNGFLFFPDGVKKYLLLESNRSGMNYSGSIHSSGLFPSRYISIKNILSGFIIR